MSNQYDGCVFLKNVRLSFPSLTAPRAPQGSDKKKYSADFILTPQDPNFDKFVGIALGLAQKKWPQHYQQIVNVIYANRKSRCFGNGDEKLDGVTYKVLIGYEGMKYLSASRNEEKGMPQMIGPDNKGIDPTNLLACRNEAGKMYGGCYVNAVVKPWVYDNAFGKGISADLVAIQFNADGEPFGAGVTNAEGLFEDIQVAQPALGAASPQFPPLAAPGFAPPAPQFPAPPQMPGAVFPPVQHPPMVAPQFAPPVVQAPQWPPIR